MGAAEQTCEHLRAPAFEMVRARSGGRFGSSVAASLGAHIAAIAVVGTIGAARVAAPALKPEARVVVIRPVEQERPREKPRPVAMPTVVERVVSPQRLVIRPAEQVAPTIRVEEPPPVVAAETAALPTPVAAVPARPESLVKTEVFEPVRERAAVIPAAREVAIGGFGAAGAEAVRPGVRAAATAGGFDAARVASGSGGGRQAARAAGFEGAAVVPREEPRGREAAPRSGFGDAVVAARPAGKRPGGREPPTEVVILFKPRADYTEEARRRRIEGEVLLEVVFAATGEVRVVRVIKGLGAGLDENAIAAARGIRFQAAREGGIAVDRTAIARIEFRLAE